MAQEIMAATLEPWFGHVSRCQLRFMSQRGIRGTMVMVTRGPKAGVTTLALLHGV